MLGPVLGFPVQERHGQTEVNPVKCQELHKGLEHLSFEERLRQLGQLSLEKRRTAGAVFLRPRGYINSSCLMNLCEQWPFSAPEITDLFTQVSLSKPGSFQRSSGKRKILLSLPYPNLPGLFRQTKNDHGGLLSLQDTIILWGLF